MSSRQVVIANIKIKNVVADVLPGSVEETRMYLGRPSVPEDNDNTPDIDENITMPLPDDPLPNCDHWVMINQKDKAIKIGMIRLKTLRQLWHPKAHWMKDPKNPLYRYHIIGECPNTTGNTSGNRGWTTRL
ncbi:hypothetical protein INT44_002158 [Umbelopsis vinacea]|uniref:Uncharacterized protein n=1 Tax=Umbelopsis vinacea TaxID=44442 RepID=A0A8H7Q3B9_9FUNG|nr:hypothetical protein INT44_002158 [Umbelopsis vinacea]